MAFTKSQRKTASIVIIILLTIFQLGRMIAFVNVYGGIEHDGGWMLSISRSLAERGEYTTMVSTIADPAVSGGIGVDQKFDVQAPDGRIWFFTGNGIGPSSIVPDALVLKIFGTSFWALHLGPLIFYTLFLLLSAVILYRLAGLGAVILFHAYLFFYPHLSIFLGYEAMGEVPAMFYILWAYLAFAWALKQQPPHWWHFLLAGLVIGLTLNTKLIALWSLGGIFIWAGFLWLRGRVRPDAPAKLRFIDLAVLVGGALILPMLWELVHLVTLTRIASFDLYLQNAGQRFKFILDDGSGIGLRAHSGAEFLWDKFFVLQEVAHPHLWITALIFMGLLGGGLFLLWLWQHKQKKQNLLAPMWLGWLINTVWFVSLAKTGWVRHFWFGLVLAVILLCVITVSLIRAGLEKSRPAKSKNFMLGGGALLLILIGWGFISQPHVWGITLPDEIVPYWQQKQISNKYGAGLPWIIIPRDAQAEVIDYLQQLPPEANVYYPAQHKTAELPAQVGRIFYPLKRRDLMMPHPQDVVIVGPSLGSLWMDPARREALRQLVNNDCPQPILSNKFYMICPLPAP